MTGSRPFRHYRHRTRTERKSSGHRRSRYVEETLRRRRGARSSIEQGDIVDGMTRRLLASTAALLLTATLASCSADEEVPDASTPEPPPIEPQPEPIDDVQPSQQCLSAMEAAAGEPDAQAADSLLEKTAYACESGAAWVAALSEYPAAMGLTQRADFSLSLDTICWAHPESPTCEG